MKNNARNVVNGLLRCADDMSYIGIISSDCMDSINTMVNVCVEFVKKSSTMVVHCLARTAYSMSGFQ